MVAAANTTKLSEVHRVPEPPRQMRHQQRRDLDGDEQVARDDAPRDRRRPPVRRERHHHRRAARTRRRCRASSPPRCTARNANASPARNRWRSSTHAGRGRRVERLDSSRPHSTDAVTSAHVTMPLARIVYQTSLLRHGRAGAERVEPGQLLDPAVVVHEQSGRAGVAHERGAGTRSCDERGLREHLGPPCLTRDDRHRREPGARARTRRRVDEVVHRLAGARHARGAGASSSPPLPRRPRPRPRRCRADRRPSIVHVPDAGERPTTRRSPPRFTHAPSAPARPRARSRRDRPRSPCRCRRDRAPLPRAA